MTKGCRNQTELQAEGGTIDSESISDLTSVSHDPRRLSS